MVASCDTFVVVRCSAGFCDGEATVFAKNSDRPRDERQSVRFQCAETHDADFTLKCTYVSVRQCERTFAYVYCQPEWCWGAEMGVNENGVAVGNEAIYTTEPYNESGLLGMDIVRLVLERATSAREGVTIVTSLLEQYGQGGVCADDGSSWIYHNSFLIADAGEAWVVETAGRWWVAEKVTNGARNITNKLSIEDGYELCSEGLEEHARSAGLWTVDDKLNFAVAFASKETAVASAAARGDDIAEQLSQHHACITPSEAAEILRRHDGGVCMHEPEKRTVGALVCVLRPEGPSLHFVTATPSPCSSVFKPFQFNDALRAGFPWVLMGAGDGSKSLWSAHALANDNGKGLSRHLKELQERIWSDPWQITLSSAAEEEMEILKAQRNDTE